MQAIVETVFDAVYLVSVITIGILMIRGSKGMTFFTLTCFCLPWCVAFRRDFGG